MRTNSFLLLFLPRALSNTNAAFCFKEAPAGLPPVDEESAYRDARRVYFRRSHYDIFTLYKQTISCDTLHVREVLHNAVQFIIRIIRSCTENYAKTYISVISEK
jgi:hypothetical protein